MSGGAMFTLSQTAYQFKSGGTNIAPASTALGHDVDSDFSCDLAITLTESGGASGSSGDVYQLQVSKNGGAFQDVTSGSSIVTSTNGAPTQLIGASSSVTITYPITIIAADVADLDALTFRVLRNGATFTYSVTPSFTAYKGNLVSNGMFDTATTGWTNTANGSLSVQTGRLRVTSIANGLGAAFQEIATVAGNDYQFNGDLIAGTSSAVAVFIGPTVNNNSLVNVSGAGSKSGSFTAPGSSVFITCRNSGASTAGQYSDFDNIRLRDITPPPPGAGGKIKVWTGSEWVEKPVKVWDGAAWIEKPLKVWDGSAWVLA